MAELVVVSDRQLQAFRLREGDQRVRLPGVDGERLFHVDVGSSLQAEPRELEVALRRRRDVNHVRLLVGQHILGIAEVTPDREPLIQLPSHEGLRIADGHDLASLDPLNLGCMGVGDLSAADEGDLKHRGHSGDRR